MTDVVISNLNVLLEQNNNKKKILRKISLQPKCLETSIYQHIYFNANDSKIIRIFVF
jgi:hypothetical protein